MGLILKARRGFLFTAFVTEFGHACAYIAREHEGTFSASEIKEIQDLWMHITYNDEDRVLGIDLAVFKNSSPQRQLEIAQEWFNDVVEKLT